MKKRFLTSSFIVLACIIASAQAKDDIFAVVHKIKPLQIENSVQSDNFSNLLKRDIIKHVNKTSNYISPYYIGEEELANANSEKKERLDTVLCTDLEAGGNISLQTFTYENQNPKLMTTYSWNDANSTWVYFGEHGYAYDENNRAIDMWSKFSTNDGERYTRSFDQKGNVSELYSYKLDTNGNWLPSTKYEYGYDNSNNCINELFYYYNEELEKWVLSTKTEATYDNHSRITSISPYKWKNEKWIGNGNKETVEYDENGKVSAYYQYKWDNVLASWVNNFMKQNTYVNGKISVEDKKYWNEEAQSWDVYGTKSNIRIEYFYDKQGRDTLEKTTWLYSDGWMLKGMTTNKYTSLDNGDTQMVDERDYYNITTVDSIAIPIIKITYVLSPTNKIKYQLNQQNIDNTDWVKTNEMNITYDKNDSVDEVFNYTYNYISKDTVKMNDLYGKYIYDEYGNEVELITKVAAEDNVKEWVNSIKYTSFYQNGSVYSGWRNYKWNGNDWEIDTERSYVYDLDTPVDNLLTWIESDENGKSIYHKIMSKNYKYSGEDTYYYTYKYNKFDPSGISNLINDNNSTNVTVYNVNGIIVKSSNNKDAVLANLRRGVYIIEENGIRSKYIKK